MTRAAATTQPVPNFSDGNWIAAQGVDTLPITKPATGDILGLAPLSTSNDVTAAVAAAKCAFPAWRETPPIERARVFFRLKPLLEEHFEELAVSLAKEHGKILPECLGEIRRGIENVEHACGVPTLMLGTTLEDVATGVDCETILQPLRVFAAITPYNFPVMIPLWFWTYSMQRETPSYSSRVSRTP